MRIAEIYSHLNGLEFLKVHKRNLWKEIVAVIEAVDATACKTKVSKEKGRFEGTLRYAPIEMNERFCALLNSKESATPSSDKRVAWRYTVWQCHASVQPNLAYFRQTCIDCGNVSRGNVHGNVNSGQSVNKASAPERSGIVPTSGGSRK